MSAAPSTNSRWQKPNCNIVLAERWRSLGYKGWNSRKTSLYHYGESCAAKLSTTNKQFNVPAHTRTTFITAFSHDSSLIASCHGDHRIHIFNVKTRQLVKSLEGHERSPWCVTFHCSTSDILASGSLNGEVRVWDLRGGGCETLYLHHDEDGCQPSQYPVTSLSFHPYGRLLAVAILNEIHFWDWSDQKPFVVIKTKTQAERVRLVRFDSLGQFILTGVCNHDDSSEEEEESFQETFQNQSHGAHCNCRLCFANRLRSSERASDSASRRFAHLRWSRRSSAGRPGRSTASLLSDLYARNARLMRQAISITDNSIELPPHQSTRPHRRRVESSSSDSEPEEPIAVDRTSPETLQQDSHSESMEPNILDAVRRRRRLRSPLARVHENILNAQVSVNEEIQHQYNRLQFLRNERRRLELRLQDLQNQANVTNRATVVLEQAREINARSLLYPSISRMGLLPNSYSPTPDPASSSIQAPPPSPPDSDPMWSSSTQVTATQRESSTRNMFSRNYGFATDILRRRLNNSLSNRDSFSPETESVQIPIPYNVDMQVETTDGVLSLSPMTNASTSNPAAIVISPPPEIPPPAAAPMSFARNQRLHFRRRAMRSPSTRASAFALYRSQQAMASGIDGMTSYRLQWWDFTKCELPKLERADTNVVSSNCKIYNDSSVEISHDRTYVAAFVVENHEILDDSMFVGIFSLQKHNFGNLLYKKKYGTDAVCLSISPLDQYIAVGIKSRHFCMRFIGREGNVMAHVLKLGKSDTGEMETVGQLLHPRNPVPRRLVSINTVTWLPGVGEGMVYGTNTGELRVCYPERSVKQNEEIEL